MRLALNMAKMAKEGFSRPAIEETKYLMKKPRAEFREEKKRSVQFPGHKKVKAAIQRHPAMLRRNQTSSCLTCQHGTAKNLKTRSIRKGTGAPPPTRRRLRTPALIPPPSSTLTAPTGNNTGAQPSKIVTLPAGFAYSHTAVRCVEFFEHDEDTEHGTDCDPDMLTDDG
jgi:hypothetical protein